MKPGVLAFILFFAFAACDDSSFGVCTPCSRDAQCGGGTECAGASRWCTKSCTGDADCGGDHCMRDNVGNAYCFPACDGKESKCASSFGSGVSCQSIHDVAGVLVQVCSE